MRRRFVNVKLIDMTIVANMVLNDSASPEIADQNKGTGRSALSKSGPITASAFPGGT